MTTKTSKPRQRRIAPVSHEFCLEFVIDETGSMSACKIPTISGFNEYISTQRKNSGTCKLSLTKFEGGNIRTPYEDLDLQFVPNMTPETFVPAGMTNLYDAIGNRIASLAQRTSLWTVQPHVLFVVMTDGQDNASRNFNATSIKKLISDYREKGWGFAYLGSDRNALSLGEKMGFLDGEIKVYSSEDTADVWSTFTSQTTTYRAAKTAGVNASIFSKEQNQ